MAGSHPVENESAGAGRRVAAILCLLPGAYFALTAGYAVLNFAEFGSAAPLFIRYVLVPLAFAAFLVWAAFKAKPSTALMTGIYVCAILGALFLHEAVANYQLLKKVIATSESTVDPRISALHVRNALPPGATARQLNLAIGESGASLANSFLGGIPNEDVLLCVRPDAGAVVYKADRYGFNNPNSIYDAGPLDLIVVGDSFVEGMCQKSGEDVASLARKSLPKTASLGLRGNGPLMELATLGRYGPQLQPKLTVLIYYAGNDWENLESELTSPWLRESLLPKAPFGSPALHPEKIDAARKAVADFWAREGTASKTYEVRVLRNFFALTQTWAVLGLHYPAQPKPIPEFETVIERMRDLTKSWGGDLVILYVPRAERFRGALPNTFAFADSEKFVADAAKRAEVKFISLAPNMERSGDPRSFYAPDGHFSEKGAQYVAEFAVAHAKSLGIVK